MILELYILIKDKIQNKIRYKIDIPALLVMRDFPLDQQANRRISRINMLHYKKYFNMCNVNLPRGGANPTGVPRR